MAAATAASAQPLGDLVDDRIVPFPPVAPMHGAHVSLIPLAVSHSADLFKHLGGPANGALWTYLSCGPLADQAACDALVAEWAAARDPQYFAVVDPTARSALGVIAFLNIVPAHRRIEIGWVLFGRALQRTRMATEASRLLLARAFGELGYQRVEWKTNTHNAASRSAAERLGFRAEGVFRKHLVVKGRRRDTAWFSITDDEWPAVQKGLDAWLDAGNFDADGRQKRTLKACREEAK